MPRTGTSTSPITSSGCRRRRWSHLRANAKQPTIGTLIDEAMREIEKLNESLKGVLAKDYARPALNKVMLGELIDLISKIALNEDGSRSKDVLGRVYEYFLGQFAGAEGKRGGEFYTPRSVVQVLVEMLEPLPDATRGILGRVYDPCCGSGGMFVQSEKFVLSHGGRLGDIAKAGVALANGSMSSTQSGEGDIRKRMIEADVVDCMVALPGQLFYSTQIPACLWFLARNKNPGGGWRDRRGHVLFIDARQMGHLVDRTRRELSDSDVQRIANTYHAWRGEKPLPVDGEVASTTVEGYADVPGFCKSASLENITKHGFVLTPGRYVGASEAEADDVPFEVRFAELKAKLEEQFAESARFEAEIRKNLARVGI